MEKLILLLVIYSPAVVYLNFGKITFMANGLKIICVYHRFPVWQLPWTVSPNIQPWQPCRDISKCHLWRSQIRGMSGSVPSNQYCQHYQTQVYCTLTETGGRSVRCGVCDTKDVDKSHPPHLALDGSDRWWQSPTLQYRKVAI